VLDLGCGANTELAAYRTPTREVWGADFEEHPGLQHRPWFRRLPADGGIPFADARFDAVTAAWVLEHVREPRVFLAEVKRVLRPGGHFVALTPNARHYVTWLIRAFGLLPHRVTQAIVERFYGRCHHDTFPTYYRLNSLRRIAEAADDIGLRLVDLIGFVNSDYFRFSPIAHQAAKRLDRILDHLSVGLGRLYLVVVCQKPIQEAKPTPRRDGARRSRYSRSIRIQTPTYWPWS
jgi:SAM-dependent methyltransferase